MSYEKIDNDNGNGSSHEHDRFCTENASLFEANGVDEISDNSLILPINVSYGSGYIMINSEVFD